MASRGVARSSSSLKAVLSAVAKTAARMCEARDALIFLVEGEHLRLVAHQGLLPAVRPVGSTSPHRGKGPLSHALIARRIVHVRDMASAARTRYPDMAAIQSRSGSRTVLAAPMLRDGLPIGGILIRRPEVRPFSPRQISLLKTFADQAALAIENARLSEELEARNQTLTEALEQQTATSDILAVISGSPTDIQPVLDAMATSAARLCDAFDASIFRVDGSVLRLVAHSGPLPTPGPIGEAAIPLVPGTVNGRAVLERQTIHVTDLLTETERFPEGSAFAARLGQRTQVSVPLLKDGAAIGTIALRRQEVRPFRGPQLQLLKTFADQAVIAIENVRLFTELQARNRELTSALEQQTATAEILRVISRSPTDLQPIFDAMCRAAVRLCDAVFSTVVEVSGEWLRLRATHGFEGAQLEAVRSAYPMRSDTEAPAAYAIRERSVLHVPDTEASPYRMLARERGFRSVVAVPVCRAGEAIAAIAVGRAAPGAFSDRQIQLLQTFADQAVIAIENVRLFTELQARNRELTSALEQQTATAEILRVISSSPTDVQPTFEAIAVSAARLCEAQDGAVFRFDGTLIHLVGQCHPESDLASVVRQVFPIPPGRGSVTARAILTRAATHVADIASDPEYGQRSVVDAGFRSVISVPMLRDGDPVGAITVSRQGVSPFTDAHLALLQTFADQAVIAIENVRLFTELQARNQQLSDALEQQTATSQILRVISSAHTDAQPVFNTIVQSAVRLCKAANAAVFRTDGRMVYHPANYGSSPEALAAVRARYPRPLDMDTTPGIAILTRSVVHVPDIEDPSAVEFVRQVGRLLGFRSVVTIPMLREGEAVGALVVARREPGRFSDAEVELLKTFSDQAVIAIENVRLFTELQSRNREMTETLEQQTATSEILGVISRSPTDIQPVLEAVATSAARLCDAFDASIFRIDGQVLRLVAHCGPLPTPGPIGEAAVPLVPGTVNGRAVLERQTVHVADLQAETERFPEGSAFASRLGHRTQVSVPLLKDGAAIGTIALRRTEVRPFTDPQLRLLKTFADQAVIAIENVRLFTELQARNRQLSDALEQQTATSQILRVISSAHIDAQPVFDTIVQSAVRLCHAAAAGVFRAEGGMLYEPANYGMSPEVLAATRARYPRLLGMETTPGIAILTRSVVQVPDTEDASAIEHVRQTGRLLGIRSMVTVPMLRGGEAVGALVVTRREPGPFSDAEVELLKTFSDQAVIAIENVRLFTELQTRNRDLTEALDQQTATGEVLSVISGSPTNVQPVFDIIVRSAVRLCDALLGTVLRFDGERIHLVSHHNLGPEGLQAYQTFYPMPISRDTVAGNAILDRRVIEVIDSQDETAVPWRSAAMARATGFRSILVVPMIREGKPIGVINVARREAGSFSDRQIELLKTFADQAVIAIENVRLFTELQARTAQLSRSVDQLTALGDVNRALSSTLDLETVLQTIVSRANQLAGTDACSVFEYDELSEAFHLRATYNTDEEVVRVARRTPIRKGEGVLGRMAVTGEPLQIPDIADEAAYRGPLRDVLLRTGTRALLAIPLLREDHLVGGLTVARKVPGEFPFETIELLKTFATQSALAIQNARLFREIEDKSRQLEIASRHKSQFLANMSHELRTPLNAILGYTELIADRIYGDVPERMQEVLERVDKSGRHLLGLINDILDLSKIEAGQLTLALADYSMADVVHSVAASVESLAAEKRLELKVTVDPDLPLGHGDQRRLTQVVLNLVGNALKFTETGHVAVRASRVHGDFHVAVADTGPGIASSDQEKIFEEFQQAETTTSRAKGGTGLGLAIARRIIEMHGGRLWVESVLGKGSTFTFTVPVRVGQ